MNVTHTLRPWQVFVTLLLGLAALARWQKIFLRQLRPCFFSAEQCIHADKKLRDALSERQIDKMVEDSFPASDPPSTY